MGVPGRALRAFFDAFHIFSVLAWHLAKWGFLLCDNKGETPTMAQMGFRLIPRTAYLQHLAVDAAGAGRKGRWEVEAGPETVSRWRPGTDRFDAKQRHGDRGRLM